MRNIGVRTRWVPTRDAGCDVPGFHDGAHIVDDLAVTSADYVCLYSTSGAAASLGCGGVASHNGLLVHPP